jgi:hypothetical protein
MYAVNIVDHLHDEEAQQHRISTFRQKILTTEKLAKPAARWHSDLGCGAVGHLACPVQQSGKTRGCLTGKMPVFGSFRAFEQCMRLVAFL